MNTDVHQDNVPRLEKLAKPRKRTDKTNNYNAFNVSECIIEVYTKNMNFLIYLIF